ncbi:nuclear transport factor 2 family protein [Sphaerisporangium rhizosphaerae]|uniref:Nuclear transport factor 2 family protein n=1 Tax=Sphaerisporangium rhizosphaerae TaxID=2269375 RepID=A0ABW2P917_9ACTN
MTSTNTPDRPAEVIRRWFECFNTHDHVRFAECYTEDAVLEDIALGRTFKGREELAEFMRVWVEACPDTRCEPGEVILDGDRAAVPWNGTGTLLGTFPHLPDTAVKGSRIDNRGLSVMEFADNGLISRQTDYYDTMAILRQIGLIPQ